MAAPSGYWALAVLPGADRKGLVLRACRIETMSIVAALMKFGSYQIVDAIELSANDGIGNDCIFYKTGCVMERVGIAGWVGKSPVKKKLERAWRAREKHV